MKKILLIEDNQNVREMTAEILELENYEVATGENGTIGMEKARQFEPDLILCDIMMPEMDGYQVFDHLSQDEKTAGIPFIFLTAKAERSDLRKGMNMGADDYLTKPFEATDLLEAIESRLKKNNFLKKLFSRDLSGINEFMEEASQYMDLESLSKNYGLKDYRKKEKLFREASAANTLYFVESGNIKTYKTTENGKELVTGLHGAGEFLGQMSLLHEKGTYVETAVVIEDAEVCAIPKGEFKKLLYGNKVISGKFIDMVSNNLIHMQELLRDMAFAPVRQRAAKALLALYDKGIIQDGFDLGVDIPREDFAGMIGTAKETAIRTLSEFKEQGLIDMGVARRLVLLNKDKLRYISEFSE